MDVLDLSSISALDAEMAEARCGNCDFVCDLSAVMPIQHPEQRLSPGSVIPAGECPVCGALSYLE